MAAAYKRCSLFSELRAPDENVWVTLGVEPLPAGDGNAYFGGPKRKGTLSCCLETILQVVFAEAWIRDTLGGQSRARAWGS